MRTETEKRLSERKIAKACPKCPDCKEPLVFRRPDRRFMEDDRYVECVNGHVWQLSQETTDG